MTTTLKTWVDEFDRQAKGRGTEPAWLKSARRKSMEAFQAVGFPPTSQEEWRLTNFQALAPLSFHHNETIRVTLEQLRRFWPHQVKGLRLVFVNGTFSLESSVLSSHPDGLHILTLQEALRTNEESIQNVFAKNSGLLKNPFTDLNHALFQDGAVLIADRGVTIKNPIELVHVGVSNGSASAHHPRTLIVAQENSDLTVIESYVGVGGQVHFTNAVTEIFLSPNARVRHYKIQCEPQNAFHVGTVAVHQKAASSFDSQSIQLGGELVRNDISTVLDAEGAECQLNGLFLTGGQQHIDTHTYIDHAKPHCSSRELYKGILDDRSKGVFDGKIIVRPDAQHTNSYQTSRNLLLSEDAVVDTTPRLEIRADDVKCSHGATIGSLDEEALFYLRSRGLSSPEARKLLTFAFANEIVESMKVESLQCFLQAELSHRLSKHIT